MFKMKLIKRYIHKIIFFVQNALMSIYFLGRKYVTINCAVYMTEHNLSIRKGNLGDDLNVPLIEGLTGKKVRLLRTFFTRHRENLLPIGSIIENFCNKDSIIWGSGAISGMVKLRETPKKVCAVRGPLTRDFLQEQHIYCPEIYGDPALLLPLIYQPSVKKWYKLGIIPHYCDFNLPHVENFRNENPDIFFIHFKDYNNWEDVIDQIVSCEQIASSSLHGLIISDAYGIPNVRIKLSENIEGGDFKYNDYFMSVNRYDVNTIDCCTNIDIKKISEELHRYKPINFDVKPLLKSFPYELTPSLSGLIQE